MTNTGVTTQAATITESGAILDTDCPPGEICLPASGVCGPLDSCLIDDDCAEGLICVDGVCEIGGDCGGVEFVIEAVPPNLLIMLDRSGSMDAAVPTTRSRELRPRAKRERRALARRTYPRAGAQRRRTVYGCAQSLTG